MATFQTLINSARVDLQDAAKTRYTDAELLEYANDGVKEAYRLRPDFRFGGYNTALQTYVVGDTVPIPEQYQVLIKHYIVFRAEIRDSEYVDDNRAVMFLGRFESRLQK